MRIEWEERVPVETWLPKRHPLRGLLEGDGRLSGLEHCFFSLPVTALPAPRTIPADLLLRLEEYHRDLEAPPEVFESLRLLGDGAQAVVTGQQAGFLGGPLLTVIKGLTAVRVAGELTASTGRTFVPLLWAETDDHDYTESNRAFTLGPQHEPALFELPWPERYRRGPAGLLPLGPEAMNVIDAFFAASGRTEFTGALRDGLEEKLSGSRDLSHWFARQLLGLLGGRGLIVFDALEKRYREFSRDLWVRVLEEPLHLTTQLREAGERLSGAGYTPVLIKKRRRCPFFLIIDGVREPVFYERGSFRAGERVYTHLELRRRLDERPWDFSAGVNLRPILQDHLLPTSVYVGGPTELAYLQQILPGYTWAGLPPPALLLRASFTLVEPPVRKILSRQKIEPAELYGGIDGVLGAVVRRENRLAQPARWEKLRQSTLRPLEHFTGGLGPAEEEVAELARRTRGKMEFLFKELEKRTVASLRRRSEEISVQLNRSRNRLFPLGKPQERVLSPYYFLNKYGPDLLDALAEALPSDFTEHRFGTIIT